MTKQEIINKLETGNYRLECCGKWFLSRKTQSGEWVRVAGSIRRDTIAKIVPTLNEVRNQNGLVTHWEAKK